MEPLEDRSQPLSLGAKLGAVFLIGFAIYGVIYVIHYNSIKATSAYKFTVARIVDDCSINGTLGNLFEYQANGEAFTFCKIDPDLRVMQRGEALLVKFYSDDPSAYDLLSVKVPDGTVVPKDGWNEIPSFH